MKYEENVWYGWNGGECPVHPATEVEYITAASGPVRREAHYSSVSANELYWSTSPEGWVVVAFRVIKEHKEPREWVIGRDKSNGREVLFPDLSAANKAKWFSDETTEIIHVREVIA